MPLLSQSYSQCVERIKKLMNNVKSFELPKRILIQRENAWDQLFEKYSENVYNDDEFVIRDSNSESKKNKFKNSESDGEKNENGYFSKCNIPMRKHPALIQYWIDTGNPPYQLIDNCSSVTGSSLSEVDNSKSTLLIANQCSNIDKNQSNGTSLYSSVDTIAYILSNTNVTKKSETIAIMGGVKSTNTQPSNSVKSIEENIVSKNSLSVGVLKNETVDNCNSSNRSKNVPHTFETVQLATSASIKNTNANRSGSLSFSKKSIDMNKETDKEFDYSKTDPIIHNSLKITDIPPTLVQFDKILEPENIQERQEDKVLSDDMSLFKGTLNISKQPKSFNRKKLYTGSNSPIDVIVSALDNTKRLSKNNVHPALCTPSKRNTLFSRRRTSMFQKRRKKRFSRLTDILRNPGKTINDKNSDEKKQHDYDNKPSKSSELTQSNSKTYRQTRKTQAITKTSSMTNINRECTLDYAPYDTDTLKTTIKPLTNNSKQLQDEEKLKNLIALCSRKNLEIRLERYTEKNSLLKDDPQKHVNNSQITKSSKSFSNKFINQVHELELESQDSDQSTIVIYKCANGQETNKSDTKTSNELNRKTDGETKKLHWIKRRKRIEINRESSENVKKSIIKNQRKIHRINQSPITKRSRLTFISGEDSSPKISSKFVHKSPTYLENCFIKFSSDEEDDFLHIIRKCPKEHTEKHNVIPTNDKSPVNTGSNCKNSNGNLTCQSTEERESPTALTTAMNLTILDSDDEDMIDIQKFMTDTKKIDNRQVKLSNKSSVKTKSISKLFDSINSNKKSVENTLNKALGNDSTLRRVIDNEKIDLSTKKLKLTRHREIKKTRNNTVKESSEIRAEFIDENTNLNGTVLQRNTNVSRGNECQIETEMLCTNQTNRILSKNVTQKVFEISPLLTQKSNTIIIDNFINDDEMKLHTENQSKLKRNTVDIENESTQNTEFNYFKLNDAKTDENKSIHDYEDATFSSSYEKTNEDKTHESFHSKIFHTLFDDSSSDSSLEFNSHLQSHHVKVGKSLKKKPAFFRTKSDGSELDESLHL